MTINWDKIQDKWSKRFVEHGLFAAEIDKSKPKFFVNAPYPYVNSILHIGHLYTYMRTEAFARYKRLQGFNVLFPQGWHATGSPIVSAANRIKEKEEKQVKLLKDIGIKENELVKFEKPEYWVEYFIPQAVKDFETMGMSIDWRRQFFTTELNPHYDKFIRWQFRKLREKKLVIKGKFPVVWCPKDNNAVSDHSRSEGEGETPLEYLLVKHKLSDGRFVISATLRQDTILGITNLYVNPKTEYLEAKINDEIWILGQAAVTRLQNQEHNIKIIGKVLGKDLIGLKTKEFSGKEVIILPATFLKEDFGTGLVHSVPSDSADDLIALQDLQKDNETLNKFNLDLNEVKAIKPIAVLKMPGFGEIPAQDFLSKYDVKNQNERGKLDKIKKEMYKLSHHTATLNDLYKEHFSKDLSGFSVEDAKEIIKDDLLKQNWVLPYYELTGKVVCRCLTECIVKIVDDQWFMEYGNKSWKDQVHKALGELTLYPEKARAQFEYVIDWLHNWACTRETGLGTRLPWDPKWLIESLSDSTIYMAYYTIVHLIKDIDSELLDDNFFDYIFLDKENDKIKVDKELAKKMKEEFEYWYPVDFRNSGKDLIQNHLTFYVFNHTAIFPEKYWPKGIGVNGWVTVDGEKMSKSKGNMISLREMPGKFGVDAARFTILNGGEEIDDPNWDSSFATSLKNKLEFFYEFSLKHHGKGRDEKIKIDSWMESQLNQVVKKTTEYMDKTLFRSALQQSYFELNNVLKWYKRRCNGRFNRKVIDNVIESQLIMLSPVIPFICEETWEKLGMEGYISLANWPKYDENKIDLSLGAGEELIRNTINDVLSVIKLTKVDNVKKVTLFISHDWKYELFSIVLKEMEETRNPGEILKKVMSNDNFKIHGKVISKFLPKMVGSGKVPAVISSSKEELEYLQGAKEFLEKEFGCSVEVVVGSKGAKAMQAMPGKVGILVD